MVHHLDGWMDGWEAMEGGEMSGKQKCLTAAMFFISNQPLMQMLNSI